MPPPCILAVAAPTPANPNVLVFQPGSLATLPNIKPSSAPSAVSDATLLSGCSYDPKNAKLENPTTAAGIPPVPIASPAPAIAAPYSAIVTGIPANPETIASGKPSGLYDGSSPYFSSGV